MSVTIYHNPRCSKSRQTLQLLQEKGIPVTVVEYLKNPPTQTELKSILEKLKIPPRDLMRKKESEYVAQNLDDQALSDIELITAMTENPILIERPIVVNGAEAALGRPPENVLKIV
jgi:arsenate reductase